MACYSKVVRGKCCIFKEEKLLAKFETKEVESHILKHWIDIFDGVVGHVPDRGMDTHLDWSAGIRERKRAMKAGFSVYSWDSKEPMEDVDIEDGESLDDDE